jgi:hypothetical protein
MEPSAEGGSTERNVFWLPFSLQKNTGWDCNRFTSSKQKGGTWGDDSSSLRYSLLHTQPESHSREKVGHMKSEGLVCPTNADCPPKGLLGRLKEWVRSALAFVNPS